MVEWRNAVQFFSFGPRRQPNACARANASGHAVPALPGAVTRVVSFDLLWYTDAPVSARPPQEVRAARTSSPIRRSLGKNTSEGSSWEKRSALARARDTAGRGEGTASGQGRGRIRQILSISRHTQEVPRLKLSTCPSRTRNFVGLGTAFFC